MKRWHILIIVAGTGLAALLTFLLARPAAPLDLSHDEEPFRSMRLPPRMVVGLYYMDGGSVGLHMIDGAGTTFDIGFPFDRAGVTNSYPTAVEGDMNHPGRSLSDPERAKEIALRLMRDHGDMNEEPGSTRIAIRSLSGGFLQVFHAWRRRF